MSSYYDNETKENTSLIGYPSFTNHSFIVASLVPSPKSGRLIGTIDPNILIKYYCISQFSYLVL